MDNSHMNPFHTLKPYLFKIHFNIINLFTPRSLPFSFLTTALYSLPIAAKCPAHIVLLDFVLVPKEAQLCCYGIRLVHQSVPILQATLNSK
jgi:hypothetical protein